MVDARARNLSRARRALGLLTAFAALAFAIAIWRLCASQPPQAAEASGQDPLTLNPNVAYETSDWPLWPVAATYAGTMALLVLCCFVLMAAYPDALPDADRTLRIRPPGPMLQTNPRADLGVFRAQEDQRLDKYYWSDRSNGLVHIPIEDAMRRLAASSGQAPARAAP